MENNKAEKLRELKGLLDQGILTQEEYEKEKVSVLNEQVINQQKPTDRPKKKGGCLGKTLKIIGGIVVAFFALIILIAIFGDSKKDQTWVGKFEIITPHGNNPETSDPFKTYLEIKEGDIKVEKGDTAYIGNVILEMTMETTDGPLVSQYTGKAILVPENQDEPGMVLGMLEDGESNGVFAVDEYKTLLNKKPWYYLRCKNGVYTAEPLSAIDEITMQAKYPTTTTIEKIKE